MEVRYMGKKLLTRLCSSKHSGVLYTVCPRSSDPLYIVTYYMKRVTNSWTYCFFQNSRVPRNESSVSVAFIQWLASITERINQANSAPVQSVFLTFGFRSGSLLNVILLSKQEFLHCHLKKHFLCNIFFHINIYVPCTVCPRSSDPFYVVTYYIKWVTTSWTYSI